MRPIGPSDAPSKRRPTGDEQPPPGDRRQASNRRAATGDQRRATDGEQQAASSRRRAATGGRRRAASGGPRAGRGHDRPPMTGESASHRALAVGLGTGAAVDLQAAYPASSCRAQRPIQIANQAGSHPRSAAVGGAASRRQGGNARNQMTVGLTRRGDHRCTRQSWQKPRRGGQPSDETRRPGPALEADGERRRAGDHGRRLT